MHGLWRLGAAALAAMAMSSGAVAWGPETPYTRDRSVIIETSPVDPWPIEQHYGKGLPACDDSWALARIGWFFGQKESWYWAPAETIEAFSKIREIAYRPWGYGKIPRRYCQALAHVSDGKAHTVYYSIIEDGGFAGYGTGIEWCVKGFDRNWAYAPNCRMARP